MADDLTLRYWLTTSAVEFRGVTTTTTYTNGREPHTTVDATATVTTRADASVGAVSLNVKDRAFSETKVKLSFTEDGRLTGVDQSLTGEGAKVLAAVGSLVGEAAGVLAKAGMLSERQVTSPAPAPTFPKQEILARLAQAEDLLAEDLAGLAETLHGDHGQASPLAPLIDDVERLAGLVAAQRDRLAQEQAAWSAGTDTTQTRAFVIDVACLPTKAQLEAGLTSAPDDVKEVWETLNLMATVEPVDGARVPGDLDDTAPFQDGADASIWYRRPRRARLSVWKRDDADRTAIVPVSTADVDLIDKHCGHVGIALGRSGLFSHSDMSLSLGPNGTLTAISTDHDAGAADAVSALAGLSKQVGSGVDDVAGLSKSWSSVTPSAASQEMAALQATKDRLQLVADIAKLRAAQSGGQGT